jgi:hypothetical protein
MSPQLVNPATAAEQLVFGSVALDAIGLLDVESGAGES